MERQVRIDSISSSGMYTPSRRNEPSDIRHDTISIAYTSPTMKMCGRLCTIALPFVFPCNRRFVCPPSVPVAWAGGVASPILPCFGHILHHTCIHCYTNITLRHHPVIYRLTARAAFAQSTSIKSNQRGQIKAMKDISKSNYDWI